MREGWEYKKLGEVTLYPTNRVAIQNLSPNLYVGVENLVKDRGGVSFSEQLPNAKSAIEYINDDILIGNIRPYLKKIWLSNQKGGASGDVIVVRIKDEFVDLLSSAFLCKVLSSDNFFDYDNQNTKGAKMPRGDKKAIAQYLIPLPPKSVQLEIVSELDQINELIRLKKEQLKDYDKLAQSIFYEMFGDPVENDKGWEVKKLKGFSKIVTGNTPSRSVPEYYSGNFIEWIKSDNISDSCLYPTLAKECLSEVGARKGRLADKNEILVTCIAGSLSSIGTSCILNRKVAYNQQINAITDLTDVDVIYVRFWVKFAKKYIQEFATTGMKHIVTKGVFEAIPVPLPPLPLQQEFSSCISQIERLKAEVSNAIADLETLLASRMQYWFE